MAITERYFNPDLATGDNDGTSEANAWQTWSQMQTDHVAGERVNAKNPASPFTTGADFAFAVSATDILVSIFRGYGSTIGDGVKFQMDTDGFSFNVTAEACLIQDIDATGTDTGRIVNISGDMARIENFKIVNTSTTANANNALDLADASAYNGYAECNTTGTTGRAINLTRGGIIGCELVSTANGISSAFSGRTDVIEGCLIRRKGTSGGSGIFATTVSGARGTVLNDNTIDGFTTSINLDSMDDVATGTYQFTIMNSILSNATTGISNADSATKVMIPFMSTLAFYNISGSDTEMGDNEVQNKISLTVDPYTDAANDDYTLNNTAGGGADCRGAALFGGQ